MTTPAVHPALAPFTAQVREWFARAFAEPTPAQVQAWPAISAGAHTLVSAPTGSGKTLAAFLWALDRCVAEPPPADPRERALRLVYISPLKALGYDVERNLKAPLRGIGADVRVAVRTGDTPQRERAAMLRTPPDILITTPESLYLMLTSQARELFTGTQWVIVDEIHAVAQTKRGAHLAVTLERLAGQAGRDVQRIGLSATQQPLDEVARFLVGPGRECTVVDAGVRKPLDLRIHVPVESMVEPDAPLELDPVPGGEATRRSIWPAIYPELLRLVREHRSTLVFVNNRRAAERIALRLNDLAAQEAEAAGETPREIARAHHGSLAREERLVIEDLLKAGTLPCLVATSSLELGIDMGAVDLVIQVESPKSVTRGLQRIGRAGHGVGEVSRGRIFPKFRADLLECAVVARRMREGLIETTVVPRNPLDVLAQQVVAIAASAGEEGVAVDELHALFRRTWTYAELERRQLENVLDMLDGRYPSQEFGELRPRIVWDRLAGTVRPRPGARALAVANAGTIPDRGLFSVNLPDGRRVGELDEEMVYEARAGQTFLLGATSWRIEQITRDRVVVTPAPGVPGAVPFWHGEGVGRPRELGAAIGAFAREAVRRDEDELRREYDLDERAASNLLAFLREQEAATGVVPSDRTLVAERFRDEIGDWRLCVLSPYGGRVHAAWALALSARIRDQFGLEADAIWSDDGIIVHLPDADEPPGAELVLVEPDEVRGPGGRRARRQRAVRRPVPRERRALAAHPARLPGAPHAALAAAPQGAVAARGRAAVPAVPGDPRDVPRVPARRAGRAGPGGPAAPGAHARGGARRGGDPDGVAVRLLAALRLRGDVHVRGRHPRRGAARGRPGPGPGPPQGAARPGGAARPDRPGGARARRGRPAVPVGAPARPGRRRAARRPAARRRSDGRGGRRACGAPGEAGRMAGAARRRAPRRRRPHRRRGALVRRRGRRAVPRRPRRRAARRPPRRVPRGRAGRDAAAGAALRPHARPLRDGGGAGALRGGRRAGARGARARRRARPGRAAPARDAARVVRPGGAPPAAQGVPRGAAQGDRARGAGDAGTLRPRVAGRRPVLRRRRGRRPPARRAGAAPGPGAGAGGVGEGRAAAPARHVLALLAGRALRQRRGGLDRRRPARRAVGARRAVLPRGRAPARPAARAP